MRLPVILMLAVIVFTPANIRDVALDAAAKARQVVAELVNGQDETTQVAEASVGALKSAVQVASSN
jgi:hypothetical protein